MFRTPVSNEVFVKRFVVQIAKLAIGCSLLFVAACAVNSGGPPVDYVEVPNPGITMYPDAPATIWVPRKSVESGLPRAGELIKKGYEKATGAKEAAPQAEAPVAVAQQAVPPAPVAVSVPQQPVAAPHAAEAAPALKNRIAVLESGDNGLLMPFSNRVKSVSAGILVDQHELAFLAKDSVIAGKAERGAFSVRLQQEYGINVVVFITAPDQFAPGKSVEAAIYDGLGGVLVRTVSARIPQYAGTAGATRDAALDVVLAELAANVKHVVALLPWYGKVVAMEGDRAYINAGKEAGLRIGQILRVYHGGKVIPGLGFEPGARTATLEISGFIGADGAYGVVRDGKGVQANDLVGAE